MKYSNKHKKAREHWARVESPDMHGDECLKQWCQNYGSKSRFYYGAPMVTFGDTTYAGWRPTWTWYFEDPNDALIFKLKFLTK